MRAARLPQALALALSGWLAASGPLATAQSASQPAGRASAPAAAQPASSATTVALARQVDNATFAYTTQRGDTLIGLGSRLLADASRWPEVAQANRLRNPNRIATGTVLLIPLRLMRSTPASATVLSVIGRVESGGAGNTAASALKVGQTLAEGTPVDTGADGHVSIRLVDGTLLRLRPDSRLQLRESRELRDAGAVRSGARLSRGRIEIEAAPAKPGRAGFNIDTPHGVLGVRGTEFRVAVDEAAGFTRGEVLGGVVAFSGTNVSNAAATAVSGGFGSLIGPAGVTAPARLLPAPQTAALPKLQERLLMRFPLAAIEGAARYRGQVSRNEQFDLVVADLTSSTPELRFADLPDGDYVLRVRAVDAQGLEGRDADHRFRLKARPEAPLPSAPQPRAVGFGSRIDFGWAANAEAQRYRLQLAATPDFKAVLRDVADLRELATPIEGLQTGTYHWRIASVRADGDQGPWSEPRSFELRPLPPTPKPPAVSDQGVSFAWEGLPGQTFEFEVARDLAFTQPVLQRKLDKPGIDLPLPGTGRFYVRLRATDPDGFVGPYTTPQFFDVPNCLRDGGGLCVRAGEQTLNLAP